MNDRARMNSRREFYRRRRELDDNLLEYFRRILYSNDSGADLFGQISRNNDSSSAGLAQLRKLTRIIEKRDFVDGGFGQRSCAGNFCLGIPLQLSAGQLHELFQSKRHNSLLNCRGACAKRLSDLERRELSPPKLHIVAMLGSKRGRDIKPALYRAGDRSYF